jgi:hypothetical protein
MGENMNNEKRNLIWKELDSVRSGFSINKRTDILFLERLANELGIDRLREVLNSDRLRQLLLTRHSLLIPDYLISFIEFLANDNDPKSYYDPWITSESYLIRRKISKPVGFCEMRAEFEILQDILDVNVEQIQLGISLTSSESLVSNFDFICSFPPFEKKVVHQNEIVHSSDFTTNCLIDSFSKLNDNGVIVLLMSPRIAFHKATKALLRQHDITINGLFFCERGTFAPVTNMSSYLVVASKKRSNRCFVAKLTADERTNEVIFKNFKNAQIGKAVELGRLVDFDSFDSFHSLFSLEKLESIGKKTGIAPTSFGDLINDIVRLKSKSIDDVVHQNNCIYMRIAGNHRVYNDPAEIKNLKNCFQITLKSEKVNSKFLTNYFNSPLGMLSISSRDAQNTIPHITKKQLSTVDVFVPDLSTQLNIIETNNKIDQLTLDLADHKKQLWRHPKAINSINKKLAFFEKDEKVDHWIDSLPFPISSILWKYFSTNETSKKEEHLLHFFEAFSEFVSMLMISAFNTNKEIYETESHKWKGEGKFEDWYLRADFGGWNNLAANLSKATRTLLNEKDSMTRCNEMFGNPEEAFLEFITSKSLINILSDVREYRNKWKGHGGVANEKEHKNRVTILEAKLTELRKLIGDGFSSCKIISANSNTYSNGIYTFNAKELTGNRTPFNEIDIESLIPLDKNKLYIVHSGQNKPIELVPFIKFNQETGACYYYSSMKDSKVRWISFHYEEAAELSEELDDKIEEMLNILKRNTE